MTCHHCKDKHDGWIRESDGSGDVYWVLCVCSPTNSLMEQERERISKEDSDGNRINSGTNSQNVDANNYTSK